MFARLAFQPSTGVASAAVFLCAALWGLMWIPIRYFHAEGLGAAWTVTLMNAPAALVLLVLLVGSFARQRPHLRAAVGIGALTGLALASYGIGIVYSSVIRVTLLFYLTPIWGTLIGIYWLGEPMRWQRWAAIALGIAGLVVLVGGKGGAPLNVGDALALLSGVSWAVGAALIKRQGSIPLVGMSFFQFFFLCAFALGLGALIEPPAWPDADALRRTAPWLLLIAVGAILPAVFLIFWASQFLFPGRVGLLMMSEVLVAVISASLLLPEEAMGAVQWLGAALIVGASLVELMPARARKG